MNVKENIKTLWEYVSDMLDMEEIDVDEAFSETIEGFEFKKEMMCDDAIDAMTDVDARTLLFDIGYMAVNVLFGGDFETWNCTLEGLGFDEETIEFLNY